MGRKINIIITISLILAVFIIPYSNALGSYPYVGGINYDYQLDRGFFSSTTNYSLQTRSITSPLQTPLIADLDGNGTNEIIVLDGSTIRLYHSRTLDIIDAVNLPTSDTYSNMYIYDIDADSKKEILIARESNEKIDILDYNGSLFQVQNTLDYSGLAYSNDGETVISCASNDRCLLVYINEDNSLGGSIRDYISAVGFTSSGVGTPTLIAQTGATPPQVFCMPRIKSMPLEDYDADGEDEYIVSYVLGHTTSNEYAYISYLWVNASNSVFLEQTITRNINNIFDDATINCNEADPLKNDTGNFVTSPLVFDVDGAPSNGLETVIGYQKNQEEFKIVSYNSDGSVLDVYPALFDADGKIISNVIRTNIDPDSPAGTDFCVMGYQEDLGIIDLLCASEQGSGIFDPESDEFEYNISGLYNISKNYSFYNNMIHSTQHSSVTTDGVDLNEIITPYGIFSIDYVGNNELLMHFQNPRGDGSLLSFDVEEVGRDDLLLLTPTNLWYIDDGYSKSPGEIDNYIINPCLDSTWKQNTSVSVAITVVDIDGDDVSAKAVLYEGEAFEQDSGWTANASSGTTFTFNFIANESIGTSKLTLYGKDDDFLTQEDSIILSISVGADGLEFGDCSTEVDVETSIEEAEEEAELEEENETIQTFVADTKTNLGISITDQLFWFLIMAVVTGAILWGATKEGWDPKVALVGVGVFNSLMLIIGIAEGFISVTILFIILLLGVFTVVGIYRKSIFGGG